MMKSHTTQEELSAYIDGEASNPDAIRQHLQRCAPCAQRHLELQRLAAHVRALPQPTVSSEFARRVVAEVETSRPRLRPLWIRFGGPLAAAAILLLTALLTLRGEDKPAANLSRTDSAGANGNPAAALVEELERRLAKDAQHESLLASALIGGVTSDEYETESIDLELAESAWSYDPGFGNPDPWTFESDLDALDNDEAEAFIELLNEYSEKGGLL